MSDSVSAVLHGSDWLELLMHFLSLSLMAVGGAVCTLPEIHRYLVEHRHWLTDAQFNASIAIAQASPGPNVLFVTLMGWNVGVNTGGYLPAILGAAISTLGLLLPSSILAYLAARWGQRNRDRRVVRAFKQGMAPVVVSLLIATGWIMANGQGDLVSHWGLYLLTAITALIVWRTRLHLLWLLGIGAVLGVLGWV